MEINDSGNSADDICQRVLDESSQNQFHDKKVLGEGQYGTTYEAMMDDKRVAIKVPKKEIDENEIEMLNNVRHKNIIRFYNTAYMHNKCCIVMELADNGNLYSILHKRDQRKFPVNLDLKEQWIRDVACGLEYLHNALDYPILHGDVKSLNVLVFGAPQYTAKLSDFGLSEEMMDGTYTVKGEGTYTAAWAAPEAVRSKRTAKSDVWSFGCLVWEILMEKLPYNEIKEYYALIFKVGSGESPYNPETDILPDKYQILLKHCFCVDHNVRWKFKQIYRYLEDHWPPDKDNTPLVSETEDFNGAAKEEFYIRANARFGKEMEDEELFKKVKNLFKDKIPTGTRDRLKDGYDLISVLEKLELLSTNSTDFLRERLQWLPDGCGKRLSDIFDDECTVDQFVVNARSDTPVQMGDKFAAGGDTVITTSCRAAEDLNMNYTKVRGAASGPVAEKTYAEDEDGVMFDIGERCLDGTDGISAEKTRYENTRSDFSCPIDKVVEYFKPIDYVFSVIGDRILKEHFRRLGRILLGTNCGRVLDEIEAKHSDQRERTFYLLEIWCQKLQEDGSEPTVEKLVSALKGAKLERTASEVSKYLPFPQ